MKVNPIPYLATGILAVTAGLAFAIEAPEDDAAPPRPEAAPEPAGAIVPPVPDAAKQAFLGVISRDLPELLSEHLNLRADEGVLIDSVMPEGPAARAGLETHDIITRVADVPVGDPETLADAITARHPGDVIKLGRIHRGLRDELEVTLGERPLQPQAGAARPHQLQELRIDGVPQELVERLQKMVEENAGGFELPGPHAEQDLNGAFREMEERMRQAMERIDAIEIPGNPDHDIKTSRKAKLKVADDEGSVEVMSGDGSREITVRDKAGQIVWSGPWDTEQDKAAPPDDVRERIERLHIDDTFKGKGIRFRLDNRNDPPVE